MVNLRCHRISITDNDKISWRFPEAQSLAEIAGFALVEQGLITGEIIGGSRETKIETFHWHSGGFAGYWIGKPDLSDTGFGSTVVICLAFYATYYLIPRFRESDTSQENIANHLNRT
jgi:hypothetical protein